MEEALVDGPYGSNGLALRVRVFVFVAMRRFVFVFFGFSGEAMKEGINTDKGRSTKKNH